MRAYYLWLDDYRKPPEGEIQWIWARSLAELKQVVRANGPPVAISFDHDLNNNHYQGFYEDGQTGLDAIRWVIEEMDAWRPTWNIHTLNAEKQREMRELLQNFSDPLSKRHPKLARLIQAHVDQVELVRAYVLNPIG